MARYAGAPGESPAPWRCRVADAVAGARIGERGFYARVTRSDLASPVSAWRLFAVRIMAMAVAVSAQGLVLAAPFVNVLVWRGGAHWLGAYAVTVALAMDAVAASVVITVALFRMIGPRRTRVVRAGARSDHRRRVRHLRSVRGNLLLGTMSRAAARNRRSWPNSRPMSAASSGGRPAPSLGEPLALTVLCGLSIIALAGTIAVCAPRFGRLALAAGSVAHDTTKAKPAAGAVPQFCAAAGATPQGVDPLAARPMADVADPDAIALPVAGRVSPCRAAFTKAVAHRRSWSGFDHGGGATGRRPGLARGVGRRRARADRGRRRCRAPASFAPRSRRCWAGLR